MKKILSMVLALAMVLSMTACGGGGSETTPPPETTVPPTTTEPAPDAAELFNEAAKAYETAESMLVSYTVNKAMTVGADTYDETEKVSLALVNFGTEEFLAQAERNFTWSDAYYSDVREIWGDGSFYSRLDGDNRTTAMTEEEFLSRYLPAVLLTPELYTTVDFVDEDTISFSGATGFEPWLENENFQLVEASGTADLTANGQIGDCTYNVIYTQGGVENELEITFRTRIGPVDAELPVDTDKFLPVDNADAIIAYERALGLTLQATDLTTNVSNTIVVAAGGALQTEQSEIYRYGKGKDLLVHYDYNYLLTDLSTQQAVDAYTAQEIFKNGTYTIAANGGAAQADRSVTATMMENYLVNLSSENFLMNDGFETITMTDLGAVSLIEFKFSDEGGKTFGTAITALVYEDPNLLNNLASAYRTETGDAFIGIDNATGLPTMIGVEYMGVHTIEGTDYNLACELSQMYTFGTGEGYEKVMGETLPVEEPAEKAAPLLYRVTGENGEEMWLFGTIHVGDGRMAYLPQAVLDAFNSADALAVEFDSGEFDEKMAEDPEYIAQILQYYVYTDGTTAADHISDEGLYQDTIRFLKASGNYNSSLPLYRPAIMSSLVENAYLALGRKLVSGLGADNQLLELARESEKKILNVESAEEQMAMFANFSDALQEQLLLEAMSSDAYEYMASVDELYEMWCRGDEAELIAYLAEDEEALAELKEEDLALYEEYVKAMETDRNEGMLEVAEGYLTGEDVVFYAVGLAHLLAEDGLVNTLREAGYTVELVPTK